MSSGSSALDLGVQLWTTPSLVSRLNHQGAALDGSGGGAGWALRRPLVESMLGGVCASLAGPGGLSEGPEQPEAWATAARDEGEHWERPFFVYQRLGSQVRAPWSLGVHVLPPKSGHKFSGGGNTHTQGFKAHASGQWRVRSNPSPVNLSSRCGT